MENELEIARRRIEQLEAQNNELKQQVLRQSVVGGGFYADHFLVKSSFGDKRIPVENIRYVFSEGKTTNIRMTDGASYVLDMSLEALELKLNPSMFCRVSRKFIVPKFEVSSLENDINGKGRLILKGENPPEIIVSRSRKVEVRRWLDGENLDDQAIIIINPQD
ncbi:MAG: LytTR family transcriptional regulator DNA-binding domain-containing protein [Bacteroidales bacterium]|nr:LytTR family transcriptional regulator DNA-binding domain-containing protein [Bacteroidales bacterium]